MSFRTSVVSAATATTATALFLTAAAPAARAQLTFFNSRPTFTAAASGTLTNANFETGAPINTVLNGPLNNTTFPLLVPAGLQLQAVGSTGSPGSGGNQIEYNDTFNTGNGTRVLKTNLSTDSLDVTFPGLTVNAFGIDIGANTQSSTYTITAFNAAGAALGSQVVTVSPLSYQFFGLTSVQNVARVNFATPAQGFQAFDNAVYNRISSGAAPEPGAIALMLSGLLPMAGCIVASRRRRAAAAAA